MANGKKVAVWLSVAVVLSVAGYFGYQYYQKKKSANKPDASKPETTATTTTNTGEVKKQEPKKPVVKNGGGLPEQTTPKSGAYAKYDQTKVYGVNGFTGKMIPENSFTVKKGYYLGPIVASDSMFVTVKDANGNKWMINTANVTKV